jgi:hypothetical protein
MLPSTPTEKKLKSICTLPDIKKTVKPHKIAGQTQVFFPTSSNPIKVSLESSNIFSITNNSKKINIETDINRTVQPNSNSSFKSTPVYTPKAIKHSKTFSIQLIKSSNATPCFRKSFINPKCKFQDPYAYLRIMKNQDFTPFQKLVPAAPDSNTSMYPYFLRVARDVKKTEQITVKKLSRAPKAYKDCGCSSNNPKTLSRQRPKELEIKNMCDSFTSYDIIQYESLFGTSFIIISFDGTMGFICESKLKLRRGAIKFLKKIDKFFKVIIVTSINKIIPIIASVMKNKGIKVSGIYFLEISKNKELMYLDDIYKDFSIKSPSNNVLVVSSLNLDISETDSIFVKQSRIKEQLNISMCPVSLEPSPITFLVPHILINNSSKPFEALLASFRLKDFRPFFNFQDWIRDCSPKFKVYKSSMPYEIVLEAMPFNPITKKCKLHKKDIGISEDLPFNYFVLIAE